MTADGVVGFARDQNVLAVGGGGGESGSLTCEGGYWEANSAKITGMTAFSQKPVTIWAGE